MITSGCKWEEDCYLCHCSLTVCGIGSRWPPSSFFSVQWLLVNCFEPWVLIEEAICIWRNRWSWTMTRVMISHHIQYVQRIWESFCHRHLCQCPELIFINSAHKVKHFPGSWNVKWHRYCDTFLGCYVMFYYSTSWTTGKFSGKPVYKSNRMITLWSTAYPGNIK